MNAKSFAICFALYLSFLSPAYSTIYLVTNTNDNGAGSLRESILQANANIGADTIQFNIGGPGVKTITVTTGVMQVQDTLFIDGSSEPGYVGLPLVEINANGATNGLFITANAPRSKIHALIVTRSDYAGIQSFADHLTITGCHIGVDGTGTVAFANDFMGIGIYNSSHVRIGGTGLNEGNLIAGNGGVGVFFNNCDSSFVLGNKLGVDITGTIAMGNAQGTSANSSREMTIGGNTAAHRNLISGNGIGIQLYISSKSYIQGNYIGTDISGTLAIPNSSNGIYARGDSIEIGGILAGEGNLISGNGNGGITLFGSTFENDTSAGNKIWGNLIGTDITGIAAIPNRIGISVSNLVNNLEIGGNTANHRNIISGNTTQGIQVNFSDSTDIYGNFVGTDISGTLALGNGTNGIYINNCDYTHIGNGTLAGANIISSNTENGIILSNGSDSTFIQHNYIGTDFSGLQYLPNNSNGIYIRLNNTNSLIGGTNAGEGNIIANNLLRGIEVNSASALNHRILGNSIYGHPNPGIQLSGGNNNQAAPDITGFSGTINTTINGTFTSAPNTTYRLEFFSSPTSAQGKTLLGVSNITTDATGNYAVNETFPVTITAAEPILTATATDPNGNTSAFGVEAVLEVDLTNRKLDSESERFSLTHPNPLNLSSRINIELQEDRFLYVRLLSLDGREIAKIFDDFIPKNTRLELSCEAFNKLSPGIYILQIRGESFLENRKVILE